MGVNKIYLIGCDFGGSNKLSKLGTKYKKEIYDAKAQRQALSNALDLVRFVADKQFLNIVSCTPSSKVNKFIPYMPLKDALGDA